MPNPPYEGGRVTAPSPAPGPKGPDSSELKLGSRDFRLSGRQEARNGGLNHKPTKPSSRRGRPTNPAFLASLGASHPQTSFRSVDARRAGAGQPTRAAHPSVILRLDAAFLQSFEVLFHRLQRFG